MVFLYISIIIYNSLTFRDQLIILFYAIFQEKVGDVTMVADLAPACKLELTSQLPSVAGLVSVRSSIFIPLTLSFYEIYVK